MSLRAIQGRRASWVSGPLVLLLATACSHDWDTLDPRLGETSIAVGGSATGGSPAGGFGGGGAGGAGGMPTGGTGGTPDLCGNGVVDVGEECDDQNDTPLDGCTACVVDCPTPGSALDSVFKDPTTFHCYRLVTSTPQAWDGARSACQGLGGDLAVITSSAEMDTIVAAFDATALLNTWLGATDVVTEGEWIWVDGTPMAFDAWALGEPNNTLDEEHCLELDTDTWNDQACIELNSFLCETPVGD